MVVTLANLVYGTLYKQNPWAYSTSQIYQVKGRIGWGGWYMKWVARVGYALFDLAPVTSVNPDDSKRVSLKCSVVLSEKVRPKRGPPGAVGTVRAKVVMESDGPLSNDISFYPPGEIQWLANPRYAKHASAIADFFCDRFSPSEEEIGRFKMDQAQVDKRAKEIRSAVARDVELEVVQASFKINFSTALWQVSGAPNKKKCTSYHAHFCSSIIHCAGVVVLGL